MAERACLPVSLFLSPFLERARSWGQFRDPAVTTKAVRGIRYLYFLRSRIVPVSTTGERRVRVHVIGLAAPQ